MTSLAVRALSVKKNDDIKKVTDIRFLLLPLPPTNVFTTETYDCKDAKQTMKDFIHDYTRSTSVDQQLLAVNKLIKQFSSAEPCTLNDKSLCQILADLYFYAPIKHPLRSILCKALHKESSKKADLIVKSISKVIMDSNARICEAIKSDDFSTSHEFTSFIASLNGCFDNFASGVAAMKLCFPLLLPTIHQFIAIFMNILLNKSELSPARRSEVFIDLHNAIRFVLFGIQQFQNEIGESTALQSILTQCWIDLLDNPSLSDSPVDTKINSGILKVNCDRILGKIFQPRDKILSQFETINGAPPFQRPVLSKSLFYAIAIINTMIENDLSVSEFFPALKVIVNRLIVVGKEFSIDSCLIMAVTRALVQCSKKLITLMRKISELPVEAVNYLREAMTECLEFVWINVHHSVDCVRYLTKDLLKNLLKMGQDRPQFFGEIVNETIRTAKCTSTSETLVCLLLDYLSQVFSTEYVLSEIPNIQQRILANLFNDSCWAICYEHLLTKNAEVEYEQWCQRWIQPLIEIDASKWQNDFDRLKTVRNMFERALKTKPEAAEFILANPNISIEIYLFVLWIMRRSGRKLYAPENYRASADRNVFRAKFHPSDDIRIFAFRILIECHKTSSKFPVEDLKEILSFFRYNCNTQNASIRQQINTTMKRAMVRIECGYSTAKRQPSDESTKLCETYERFLHEFIEFCVDFCLFDGSNFGRRATGLTALLYLVDTWQKLLPTDRSIYSEKLWARLQKMLADSYVVNKDVASDILLLCWKFYAKNTNLIYNLDDLKKLVITFRPYDVMTAAHYLDFCAFSQTYFDSGFAVVIWCERLLDDGLAAAKTSLLQTARYNALYGLVLTIRRLLKRIRFASITDDVEIEKWRAFFQRIIPKCKELTDVAAPVVNSSAPEGHLPNDLNDVSHYLTLANEEQTGGTQIKVTAQMILLCAWRTVRESALLLGEIALNIPIETAATPNGFITVDQLLRIGGHFQQLLVETKHRGAFEQSFLGFSNLCLRLWRSHEPVLHSYPMKLVEKIAAIIAGEKTDDDPDAELDVKKLCATRRSAGIPFMVQGIATTESQVCSNRALTFCMNTFMSIAKSGPVEESRTHSLNILRALFRCAELGEAVSEYISDGIECSIRGYSAPSWPERNSSTLLFSALMTRIFGVPRTKESDILSIKNKMTGRLFFIRYPRLYDFFYVELKLASQAIEQNERPPRLHPLLLLISRLYPSAMEGADSNLKLSTFISFISTCSSSPELVTRQLSAKSIVALIPSTNVAERMHLILDEIKNDGKSVNAIHGYLLQMLYLLRSATKLPHCDIDAKALNHITLKLGQLKVPLNNIIRNTYVEILLEIIFNDQMYPIDASLIDLLINVRNDFLKTFAESDQYGQLTQSYVQKTFSIFNLLIASNLVNGQSDSNTLPVVSVGISNTQFELIETHLNIKYLLLCEFEKKSVDSSEFSRYEIELMRFLKRNPQTIERVSSLLPSITELYYIIEHPAPFYPFGVIKAYEILSILIAKVDAIESHRALKMLKINEMEHLILATNREEDVDDVADAMWKFIAAHLSLCQIHPSHVTIQQITNIIAHLRNITECYKSADLRQTATHVLAIVSKYFAETSNLETLIDFGELLLKLLRDDDPCVRNQAAEIAMELSQTNESDQQYDKVVPLAAEDYLLSWLNVRFIESAKGEAWKRWLQLLRLIYDPQTNKDEEANGCNEDSNLIDVEIFDDTDPNTFDETIYTAYKCYNLIIQNFNEVALDANQKQLILDDFPTLKHF